MTGFGLRKIINLLLNKFPLSFRLIRDDYGGKYDGRIL